MPVFDELLTVEDVARILKMSESWVKGQIRTGHLQQTKLGKNVRVEPADLRAFIDSWKRPNTVVTFVAPPSIQGHSAPITETTQLPDSTRR